MDFAQHDIASLAAKLAAADLTEGEQAVMGALVEAAEAEVSGFGVRLSFAPLKPAEFMVAHELTHVQQNSAKAMIDGQREIVDGGTGI